MKFGDYYEVRDWLEEFIPLVYGKEELGLARIEHLLKLLGNPEKKFKSIHIAGTSGKGSTAFCISRLLHESESQRVKVGLHVSPHLVYIGERMQINGHPISPQRLIRLISQIRPIVESMKGSKVGSPSYFEILVAASFTYFAQEKVDYAVIEVGLGGRLDATNVLTPEVSIITNIGLDHTEILGKTIGKIAAEKAGIIKPGAAVVTAASGKALRVIEKVARDKGSKLVKVSTQKGPAGNKLLAKTALEMLGITVDDASMKKAFEEGFPGRFEEVGKGVILDGAHNPDKVRALIHWIKSGQQLTVNSQLTLVLAFKKGKRWKQMVDLLVKNLPISQVIATEFNAVTDTGPAPSQRLRGVKNFAAVPAEEIAKYVSSSKYYVVDIKIVRNSQEAVFKALQSTVNGQLSTVLVTGSLYLVGEVWTMWELPQF